VEKAVTYETDVRAVEGETPSSAPQTPLEGCPPLSDVKGIPNLYTA